MNNLKKIISVFLTLSLAVSQIGFNGITYGELGDNKLAAQSRFSKYFSSEKNKGLIPVEGFPTSLPVFINAISELNKIMTGPNKTRDNIMAAIDKQNKRLSGIGVRIDNDIYHRNIGKRNIPYLVLAFGEGRQKRDLFFLGDYGKWSDRELAEIGIKPDERHYLEVPGVEGAWITKHTKITRDLAAGEEGDAILNEIKSSLLNPRLSTAERDRLFRSILPRCFTDRQFRQMAIDILKDILTNPSVSAEVYGMVLAFIAMQEAIHGGVDIQSIITRFKELLIRPDFGNTYSGNELREFGNVIFEFGMMKINLREEFINVLREVLNHPDTNGNAYFVVICVLYRFNRTDPLIHKPAIIDESVIRALENIFTKQIPLEYLAMVGVYLYDTITSRRYLANEVMGLIKRVLLRADTNNQACRALVKLLRYMFDEPKTLPIIENEIDQSLISALESFLSREGLEEEDYSNIGVILMGAGHFNESLRERIRNIMASRPSLSAHTAGETMPAIADALRIGKREFFEGALRLINGYIQNEITVHMINEEILNALDSALYRDDIELWDRVRILLTLARIIKKRPELDHLRKKIVKRFLDSDLKDKGAIIAAISSRSSPGKYNAFMIGENLLASSRQAEEFNRKVKEDVLRMAYKISGGVKQYRWENGDIIAEVNTGGFEDTEEMAARFERIGISDRERGLFSEFLRGNDFRLVFIEGLNLLNYESLALYQIARASGTRKQIYLPMNLLSLLHLIENPEWALDYIVTYEGIRKESRELIDAPVTVIRKKTLERLGKDAEAKRDAFIEILQLAGAIEEIAQRVVKHSDKDLLLHLDNGGRLQIKGIDEDVAIFDLDSENVVVEDFELRLTYWDVLKDKLKGRKDTAVEMIPKGLGLTGIRKLLIQTLLRKELIARDKGLSNNNLEILGGIAARLGQRKKISISSKHLIDNIVKVGENRFEYNQINSGIKYLLERIQSGFNFEIINESGITDIEFQSLLSAIFSIGQNKIKVVNQEDAKAADYKDAILLLHEDSNNDLLALKDKGVEVLIGEKGVSINVLITVGIHKLLGKSADEMKEILFNLGYDDSQIKEIISGGLLKLPPSRLILPLINDIAGYDKVIDIAA